MPKKSPFGVCRDLPDVITREIQSHRADGPARAVMSTVYPYFHPHAPSPPDRRMSVGSVQRHLSAERRTSAGGLSQMHTSQSDSPSTSYSTYSQLSRTPPVALPHGTGGPPAASGYFPASYAMTGGHAAFAPSDGTVKEPYNSPVTTSIGSSTYHLMTLDTEQGPIQVPVDVQAASKVADEKRKRNATASHRFRQRRKEKERETSQNIAKLEHQVRELAEDREFYRMERDYFRNLVKNSPGQSQIGPRPTSPRQMRLAQPSGPGSYATSQWQSHEENTRNGRVTRRRTNSYVPAHGLVPPPIIPPPSQAP